jgi:uncharacterized RDD family membrane protein YckC
MELKAQEKVASLWIRVLAAILDLAVVFAAQYYIVETWGEVGPEGDMALRGAPVLLLLLATAAYWILPEWLLGATLGKLALDLRVTTLNGGTISLAQSLKRNVLRALDFFLFPLTGFVTASLTPNRQRLGDLWANTIVVPRKSRQADVRVPPSIPKPVDSVAGEAEVHRPR